MTEQNNPKPNKSDSLELLMSVIDQLHTRIQNVETDLRHAHEKISKLEQSDAVNAKVLNTQADQLDRLNKEVFDEDPVEVEE